MTGTLIRKTEPHQKFSSSAPPTTGPIATARPTAPAQTPMALPRSRGSKTFEMIDRVDGMTAAPPMPSSARAQISWPGVCAYADPKRRDAEQDTGRSPASAGARSGRPAPRR